MNPGVGSADGTGIDARFNYPTGVAVDGGGNVYVADTRNWNMALTVSSPFGPVAYGRQSCLQC